MKSMFMLILVLCMMCFGFDYSTITFKITSAAVTSTANVRVIPQVKSVARDQLGNVMQDFAPNGVPANYFLTKETTHTFGDTVIRYMIQADQNTKLYFGTGLTNYILVYKDVPVIYIRK